MSQYPVLTFLERHGGWIAAGVGLLPLAAAIVAVVMGAALMWLAAGVVGSIILFVAARSYVELIRLMTDMLMPK